ncbi:MAG: enoyl-CoA hydratase [Gammaproteobacteria bacterium]|nr:enoyl-CoA hydratase [Gammaproteobacteria bacterium]
MATPAGQLDDDLVRVETDGAVRTLTLNYPDKFNPLSAATLSRLQAELDVIAADDALRVVIIASTGKAFSAGHDLRELRALDRAGHEALFDACSKMMLSVNRLPQPVIAAVQGIATAAGCQLVAACDLAVAAETARFATSGINVGLFCATPAVPLSRNLTRKRAMEMLLTGDFIDAKTALEWGLVNRVTAPEALADTARDLAATIAAKPPVALKLGKELFYRQLDGDLEQAYSLAGEVMACNMDTDDARDGIDAFFEKRKPEWKGR